MSLSLTSLGGGLYEISIVDPAWPKLCPVGQFVLIHGDIPSLLDEDCQTLNCRRLT
jgi:hypothetical protein